MELSPPLPRAHTGKTFHAALWILGLIALAQVAFVSNALLRQVRVDVDATAPEMTAQADLALPQPPSSAETFSVAPTLPLPAAATPPLPGASADRGRISALVEQARSLRQSGDTQAAIVKLREAATLDSDDPIVLAELATTFEAMGLADRARELWGKLASMGADAGALLTLAQIKLSPGAAAAAGQTGTAAPAGDIQAGSTLGLIDIRVVSEEDPASKQKLKLRIGLKARADTQIDVRDVVIQVFFYDLLDGQHIVQTNAEVSSQWATPPADWSDDGIEILEVGYNQPLLAGEDETAESREYLGYIVRIYYKDRLEDVRADPVRLLELSPPPLQIEN